MNDDLPETTRFLNVDAAYTKSSLHTDEGPAFAVEGEVRIEELVVYPMANIWE